MKLAELMAQWRGYTSVEGNEYDEGFEAAMTEAANELEDWRRVHGPADLAAETDEFLTLRINTTLVSSPDVIAALLHFAADQVRGGNTDAPLYDSAGNQVGSYRIGPAS